MYVHVPYAIYVAVLSTFNGWYDRNKTVYI